MTTEQGFSMTATNLNNDMMNTTQFMHSGQKIAPLNSFINSFVNTEVKSPYKNLHRRQTLKQEKM